MPIYVFSGVTVFDPDDLLLQPLDITITMTATNTGVLTNLSSFAMVTTGVYRAVGLTTGQVTAELRAMQYLSQSDTNVTTWFTLEVDDRFAPVVSDGLTSVTAMPSLQNEVQPDEVRLQGAFGVSSDLEGDLAVIGAPNADPLGTDSGAAFVYQRLEGASNEWQELLQLDSSTVDSQDRFGRSVSISGDWIAVGAINNEANGQEVGTV